MTDPEWWDESWRYTQALSGSKIIAVEHVRYRPLTIVLDDGRRVQVEASGEPPSIFLSTEGVDITDDPLSGIRRVET